MRVELTADVFVDVGDPADQFDPTDLYVLLRCFPDRRHDWVTNYGVVAAVEAYLPKHLPDLADTYVALARDAMVQQAWTGTTQQRDLVRVGRADLADHSADLCRPAVLVVENSSSDGGFLHTVACALRHERVLTALERAWLEVHSAGGSGEVPRVAREHAVRYRRLVRVVALLDSDSLIPGQRTPNHDQAEKLAAEEIAVHVLALREAENYVPHRVLAGIGKPKQASQKLSLLRRLTPQQRGHLDMKTGLGKRKPEAVEKQKELFEGLDLAVQLGLHDGFGKNLLERLAEYREQLTERDFATLGDEVVAELRTMLDLIASRV
ncbi:hypothetical protein AB0B68_16065 [Micromonospora sp. NPDC049049]|uniref:hypothetical protein n=1 Tax=Micromonospora sp. NPDC049049 TaxID=3155495 RepID=UPI003409BDB3